MTIDIVTMTGVIKSSAQSSGLFAVALHHEPKSAPQLNGQITFAFWFNHMSPVQSSGLNSVSIRLEFRGRLYASALAEPADEIDPALVKAADTVMGLYCGDFDLGGSARHIDIFGQHGEPLSITGSYITQDAKIYRVFDFLLPIIVNDVWTVAP